MAAMMPPEIDPGLRTFLLPAVLAAGSLVAAAALVLRPPRGGAGGRGVSALVGGGAHGGGGGVRRVDRALRGRPLRCGGNAAG
jgi:hypothetical protein